MATEFATSHATDGMDEVAAVKILKPVLIRVVGVGTTIKVVRWRVLTTFLVASVLRMRLKHVERWITKNSLGNPPR